MFDVKHGELTPDDHDLDRGVRAFELARFERWSLGNDVIGELMGIAALSGVRGRIDGVAMGHDGLLGWSERTVGGCGQLAQERGLHGARASAFIDCA